MHARYLARRVGESVIVLLAATFVSFALLRITPGDPAELMLPYGMGVSAEAVENLRAVLGLDKPLLVQYFSFLRHAIVGDLGQSFRMGTPVLPLVLGRLAVTAELALGAVLLSVVAALPLGVVAAVRKRTPLDSAIITFTLLGQSLPGFWLGIMLIVVFAVWLNVLPAFGYGGLAHRILPTITLSAWLMAFLTRLMRSTAIEVLQEDYIRTARAKGLSERVVLLRHAMRNAVLPVVTVLGLQVGGLLGGAVITETVFSWPGIGLLAVEAIRLRDYAVVQGVVLVTAVVFVAVNLLVDVAYAVIDPRIRYG